MHPLISGAEEEGATVDGSVAIAGVGSPVGGSVGSNVGSGVGCTDGTNVGDGFGDSTGPSIFGGCVAGFWVAVIVCGVGIPEGLGVGFLLDLDMDLDAE